jgi:WD40 repeat protein
VSPSPPVGLETAAAPSDGGAVREFDFVARESAAIDEFRYEAFISYRHVEPDRRWAKWLHTALETYRVPQRLVKERGIAPRIRRIFRDEDELPASADLNKEIESALKQSRFLIVICSPRTPQSEWVNKEVERFREMGRHDQILALLVEGEPSESFPRALREIRRTIIGPRGVRQERIEETEPLAADVRPARTESMRHLKRLARLRMLACILGCRFDDLRRREHERFVRRAVLGSVLGGVLLLVIAALVTVSLYLKLEAQSQRAIADEQRLAVLEAEKQARLQQEEADRQSKAARVAEGVALELEEHRERTIHAGRIRKAWELLNQGQPASVLPLLAECRVQDRAWEWGYLRRLAAQNLSDPEAVRRFIRGESGAGPLSGSKDIVALAFSPDGKYLAWAGHQANEITVWDLANGQRNRTLKAEGRINSIAMAADGKRLAAAFGRQVVIWELETGTQLLSPSGVDYEVIECVDFSPDGRLLAVGGRSAEGGPGKKTAPITVWDLPTDRKILLMGPDQHGVQSVCFAPDGKRLASSSIYEADVWDVDSGRRLVRVSDPPGLVGVTFSPDGKRFAAGGKPSNTTSGCTSDHVTVYDAATGRRLLSMAFSEVTSFAYTPDGNRIIVGCKDKTVSVRDARTGQELISLPHGAEVAAVAVSRSGTHLAVACRDGTVVVREAERNRELFSATNPTNAANSPVAVDASGEYVVEGAHEILNIWHVLTGKRVATLTDLLRPPSAGVFFLDSQRLVVLGDIYDVSGGRCILKRPAFRASVGFPTYALDESVGFSRDGRRLGLMNKSGDIVIWDVENNRQLFSVPIKAGCFAMSADGRRFAASGSAKSAEESKTVRVWDLGGHQQPQLLKHRDGVVQICMSTDGRILAARTFKELITWQVDSAQILWQTECPGHLALSQLLAVAGGVVVTAQESRIELRNVKTGALTLTLDAGDGQTIRSLACTPDGKFVVSTSDHALDITNGHRITRLWYTGE